MPTAKPESRTNRAGRPRIGFVAGLVDDAYEWTIWQSARRTIEQAGGSAVYFAGACIEDPSAERRARARIFDFVQPSSVDALLCVSSVIGHFVGVPGTERWLLQRGLLACSIGPAEHVPSVTVDDSSGMTQLMRHLIRHHQHKRIAFVTGSPSNAEAQRRLSAYIQVLTDHGLSFDPRLTLTGDFTSTSGARAIHELLDNRQISTNSLDAIVCSNDYMAFGVIEELVRRRIRVPDEIAVVGFDDIPPSGVHTPSLTTVRQPLEELGRQGALRLLGLLDGAAAEGALTLDTELVLRRSCGCVPTDLPAPLLEDGFDPRSRRRPLSSAALEAALAAELGLSRLGRALHERMFGPQAHLSTALAELMPPLGLPECAVSELAPRAPGETRDTLELVFGFDAENRQPALATFEAGALVPPAFDHLRQSSCLVLPLTSGTRTLGIAVTPASDHDGPFYAALAEHFGTVLKVLELRRRAERS